MGAENLVGQFHIQDFLDKIADLDLDPRIQSWYTVDVTAMLGVIQRAVFACSLGISVSEFVCTAQLRCSLDGEMEKISAE